MTEIPIEANQRIIGQNFSLKIISPFRGISRYLKNL